MLLLVAAVIELLLVTPGCALEEDWLKEVELIAKLLAGVVDGD